MARSATSPAARLRRLEAALEQAKKLRRGTVLSAKPMAELLGVSWVTLRDQWCNDIAGFEESGAFVRGGNGVEWKFRPAATIRFLIAHFTATTKARTKRNAEIRRQVGIEMPDSESAASFDETKGLMSMTLQVVDAAERQGRYMLAEDVARFIAGYNDAVVAGIMGVRTKADPNGNLPPPVRADVDDYLRQVANDAHAAAEAFVGGISARLQQGGTG